MGSKIKDLVSTAKDLGPKVKDVNRRTKDLESKIFRIWDLNPRLAGVLRQEVTPRHLQVKRK